MAYEFEGRQTSFAEFDRKTNRVANALRALGVKPGERIAYLGKNSDIYFELLIGAIKADVVMAPRELAAGRAGGRVHRRTTARRRFLIGGSAVHPGGRGIRGPIRQSRSRSRRSRRRPRRNFHDWYAGCDALAPTIQVRARPSDIAMQLYSSGTTGLPKGVELYACQPAHWSQTAFSR